MATAIRLEGVTKAFAGRSRPHVAVDDVTLDVPAGSFTTLVGPSGCGKTTTLRIIAGLETPTAGDVLFDGEVVTDRPPQERNVAMVFQSIALYPHMTVRENIGYALKVRGVPAGERNDRVEEAARTLQIADQLEKRPAELSGGQQQRVALGGTLVQDPEVLLLDEPMSDLDAKLKAELRVEIQRLHRELGVTVVYVTHDQTEGMTMSDRLVLMRDGRVEQVDSPRRLFDRPASEYAARFVGTPSMNVLDCVVERTDDGGRTLVGHGVDVPVGDRLPDDVGSTVRLGLRPQHLRLGGGECSFAATVELVEPLGTESVLHGRTADGARVDVVSPAADLDDFHPGDEVVVGFSPVDVVVFDGTGRTVLFGDERLDGAGSP